MRLLFVLLYCLLFSASLPAQTAAADLQKVLAPLLNAPQLYFENKYLYYEAGEKSASDTLWGIFQRNGNQQFIRMGLLEILETGTVTVTADHEDRTVAAQSTVQDGSLNNLVDAAKLKGLLDAREAKVQYVASSGSYKAVLLIDPEKPEDKIVIQYDPKSWVIREATLTTDDPFASPLDEQIQKVTIRVYYLNYSTAPRSFPYKLEQYVRKEGKKYRATGKCSGYRVI